MTTERVDNQKRHQLLEEGFCVMEGVLDEAMLQRLTQVSEALVQRQNQEEAELNRSTGSMIPITEDPLFASLVAWPGALRALARLGYDNPKFSSGFVISKPPSSPRLFWHYDYGGWEGPEAFGDLPQQLFLMYYLIDTTPQNGCLRVIPRSHQEDNSLHGLLREAHSDELRRALDENNPAFSTRPDEVDVTVRAGDLVVGDSRLLHAAHANNSTSRRTVITLWYHPDMPSLPEPVQAFIAQMAMEIPDLWPAESKAILKAMSVNYEGSAEPTPWNRQRPMRNPSY